jgi:hypothetical protein
MFKKVLDVVQNYTKIFCRSLPFMWAALRLNFDGALRWATTHPTFKFLKIAGNIDTDLVA